MNEVRLAEIESNYPFMTERALVAVVPELIAAIRGLQQKRDTAQSALAAELLKCVAAGRVKIHEDNDDDSRSFAFAEGSNFGIDAALNAMRAKLAELKVEVKDAK